MDNLTHGLVGALIGQAGLKRKTGLAMPALVIGANLPDVDAACFIWLDGVQHLGFRRVLVDVAGTLDFVGATRASQGVSLCLGLGSLAAHQPCSSAFVYLQLSLVFVAVRGHEQVAIGDRLGDGSELALG